MRAPDFERSFGASVRTIELRDQSGKVVQTLQAQVPPHKRQAWRVAYTAHSVDQTAMLACWLVCCPHVHTMWNHWWICLIHLRDIEGTKPAVKSFPQAEYEFSIYAHNPDHEPNPDDNRSMRFLFPVDVQEQFCGLTDAQAVDLLTTWVRGIVDGLISPDSDDRAEWKRQVILGVQHLTTGHPVVDA